MLTLLLVISLAQSKPVEVIRGGTPAAKKAAAAKPVPVNQESPSTASTQNCAPKDDAAKADLEAKAKALDQKASDLAAKEQALDEHQQQADRDAKTREQQIKQLEKHGADLRREYRNAANALAGE